VPVHSIWDLWWADVGTGLCARTYFGSYCQWLLYQHFISSHVLRKVLTTTQLAAMTLHRHKLTTWSWAQMLLEKCISVRFWRSICVILFTVILSHSSKFLVGLEPSNFRFSSSHSVRHTTVGRTSLDEGSARRWDTHWQHSHSQETDISLR
jgi:hypothetical protein